MSVSFPIFSFSSTFLSSSFTFLFSFSLILFFVNILSRYIIDFHSFIRFLVVIAVVDDDNDDAFVLALELPPSLSWKAENIAPHTHTQSHPSF